MKAQTPDNPELGCSGSGRPLCGQEMTPWTRDKLERGNQGPQKDQEPFAGTALSVQVVSSSITPCALGLSPREPSHEPQAGWETLLPTSFPPSTSTSSQDTDVPHLWPPVTAHGSQGCKSSVFFTDGWKLTLCGRMQHRGWDVGRKTHRPGTKEPSDHWKTKSL